MTSKILERFEQYRKILSTDDILVFDCETKLIESDDNKTIYTHLPELVLEGVYRPGRGYHEVHPGYVLRWLISEYFPLFVGHNVMFDVLVDSGKDGLFHPKLMVWDTMKSAYLLSDQRVTNASLDELAEYYGLPGKDEKGAALIKAGVCPSTWPEADLKQYLEQDVLLTKNIFLKQLEQFNAKPKNWQNMFINHMFYLVETTLASMSGMTIDKDQCDTYKAALTSRIGRLTGSLQSLMLRGIEWSDSATPLTVASACEQLNPMSPDQISKMLYGGTMDFHYKEPAGTYKTGPKAGTCKYRNAKVTGTFKPLVPVPLADRTGTDEETLTFHRNTWPGTTLDSFCTSVLELRDCSKTLNTYLESYMDYAKHDGFIHTSYNHTTTPTKRLTCSKPNLQNIKGD